MAAAYTIGLVLDDTLDRNDGVQQYVLTLGAWLSSQGHTVHYLVGRTVRTDIANLHSVAATLSVRFNRNRLATPLPVSRRVISSLLDDTAYDILHVQMPFSPFFASRVIQSAGARTAVVGTFHIVPYSRTEQWASRLLGRFQRKTLARFDEVISVSLPARVCAKDCFGLDSHVVPNAIDARRFAHVVPEAKPVKGTTRIVFLGRLVERKGCLQLLQAIAQLATDPDNGQLEVAIYGDGSERARLEAYAKHAGITDIVHFGGFVPEADKSARLAAADIAVFPSLGGESFGIVLLEAMAAGAGVVMGGDNAGYLSVLGAHPECLVNPRDTAAFAASLNAIIRDRHLAAHLHSWQQQLVMRYDISTVGADILKVYETAIAKRAQ